MSDTATSLPAPRPAMALLVTLRRNKLSWIAIALLAAIVLMAVFAPLLASVDPIKQNIIHRLEPPSAEFLLRTDSSGRDLLSPILYVARATLLIGFVAVAAAMLIGPTIGIIARNTDRRAKRMHEP